MRTRNGTTARSALLALALLAVALVGCGTAGDQAADSRSPAELPTNLASVEVTYYYLPG